jgi:hypothetical protein
VRLHLRPGTMPCYHGLVINDYNSTTTSQEGGAVPEARPLCRVSGAVNSRLEFSKAKFFQSSLHFLH